MLLPVPAANPRVTIVGMRFGVLGSTQVWRDGAGTAATVGGSRLRALHGSGRPAEALAAYEQARQVLADELGTDPSAERQPQQQQP